MSNESMLRKKARKAIRAGRLPDRPANRTWGGRGEGNGVDCPVCRAAVKHDEVEFEIEFANGGEPRPRSYHLHVQCFAAWESERRKFQDGSGTAGRQLPRSARSVAGSRGLPKDDAASP